MCSFCGKPSHTAVPKSAQIGTYTYDLCHMCRKICMYSCMHVCMHVCMHLYAVVCICMCICMHICKIIINTHTHTYYIYIYIHVRVCVCVKHVIIICYCAHEHITCICLSEGRASVHDDCLLFGKVLAQYTDPSFAAPACQGTWGSEDMSSRLNSGHKSANPSTSSPVKARLRCKDGQKLHSLQLLSRIAFGQALTVHYVLYSITQPFIVLMAALPLAIVTQDDCDTCFQSGSLLPLLRQKLTSVQLRVVSRLVHRQIYQ